MAFIRKAWRERPLSDKVGDVKEFLRELVEAWNRELSPLLNELRSEIQRLGGDYQVVSADYSMQRSDATILADATDGIVTLTMVSAADVKHYPVMVTKTDASANTVVLGFGAETCSGANTVTLLYQFVSVTVQSDGTNYYIVSTYP